MTQKSRLLPFTGKFESVNVYENRWMRKGAGIALPGIGIIVYSGANTFNRNLALLRHEFGHILQARKIGLMMYYFRVGIPSLLSAMRNGERGHCHQDFWTEVWANQLAEAYFTKKQS